jgi:hypothetical protein
MSGLTYKGRALEVSTFQDADGKWRARAMIVGAPESALETPEGYASPGEAIQAVQSLAAGQIDRERAMRGKP